MTGAVAEVRPDLREPAAPAPPSGRRPLRGHEILLWLMLGPAILLCGWVFVAEPVKIPSTSMVPTLRAGDHVVVNKLAYRLGSPQIGDIAVLHSPETGELLIKRIVAAEGQRVEIRDGVLHVDRVPQREAYVDYEMVDGFFFGPYHVPAGAVFVLGDDRGDSKDSREFGPVPVEDLVGRADWRIAPLSRLGAL